MIVDHLLSLIHLTHSSGAPSSKRLEKRNHPSRPLRTRTSRRWRPLIHLCLHPQSCLTILQHQTPLLLSHPTRHQRTSKPQISFFYSSSSLGFINVNEADWDAWKGSCRKLTVKWKLYLREYRYWLQCNVCDTQVISISRALQLWLDHFTYGRDFIGRVWAWLSVLTIKAVTYTIDYTINCEKI